MSNGIANGVTKLGTEAFRSWGMLGAMVFVICFFLSGVFVYLDRERNREIASAERRDVREGKLVNVLSAACSTLQKTSLAELSKNRVLLERMEKHNQIWVPVIKEIGDYVQEIRSSAPGHRKAQP